MYDLFTDIASSIYDRVANDRSDLHILLKTRVRIQMIPLIGQGHILRVIMTGEIKQAGTLLVVDIIFAFICN